MDTPEEMNDRRDEVVVSFFDTLIAYKGDRDYRHIPRLRRLAEQADNMPHGYARNPEKLLQLTTEENLRKWRDDDPELVDRILSGCRGLPNYMTMREVTHRAA